LTRSLQLPVLEEPGTIIVYRGFGCAESNRSGTEDIITVEGSVDDLPAYATNATVFLNGWRMQYLHSDHHVAALGTVIKQIRLEGRSLKWRASGVLSDQNFDDGYSWCYHYTVVAWNPANLDLTIDHDDGSCDPSDPGDPFQANHYTAANAKTNAGYTPDPGTTALSFFPSFLRNPGFAGKPVAILPRGFGFAWGGVGEDHHLLQIAYNLHRSEIFVDNNPSILDGRQYRKLRQIIIPPLPEAASQVGSGFVSWETSAIYKDNDLRRDYEFGEIVSGLGGVEVGVVQAPFSILPREDDCGLGGGRFGNKSVLTREYVVENVPYEFAIPMLTGWELNYGCDDEHVQEIGVWIDGWSYDRGMRKLTYKLSSVLRDRDNNPGHFRRHNVSILGLRPAAVGPPIPIRATMQ
jgi:hypothetical protein